MALGHRVNVHKHISPVRRSLYLGISALFLFFLIYSTPHQVHHVFDQVRQSDHHSEDHHSNTDRRVPAKQNPTCVFQSVASRCHAKATAVVQFSAVSVLVQNLAGFSETAGHPRFIPGTFHIRAPPTA
jgi:hypothetical protein